ncbi:MAG TPA: chromate resistance protein ChrB domain-containing protein [Vicinamibacterales bacterium]|nr:chromate resistance protein ChrB domain-containing protein [Vicinamibacterales bacterium]
MNISPTDAAADDWLLLLFSLPAGSASRRVEIWRKLRRYGALPLKNSGYVLPRNPATAERFQWLAADIRRHKGEASVVQVAAIDDLPGPKLARLFQDARAREYDDLAKALQRLVRRRSRPPGVVARLRRRYEEIADRDFYRPPSRGRVEQLLARLAAPDPPPAAMAAKDRQAYFGRQWVTRPRPGIDRVSSAWLIRRFIDPAAAFAFADDTDRLPEAVPFDMFAGRGFSHRGDRCTFETLVDEFGISDPAVLDIARAVHDADLADEKFGRTDALALERVLAGWARQGLSDDELLRRGMEMFEGWYQGEGR